MRPRDDRGARRIENLEELVGVAREFRAEREEATLDAFLQEIQLQSDQDPWPRTARRSR